MINNYLKTVNKPYSSSSTSLFRPSLERQSLLPPRRNKYALLALILARSTYKTLRLSFLNISQKSRNQIKLLQRLCKIAQKNHSSIQQKSFWAIKQYVLQTKKNQRLLKNLCIITRRVQKDRMKQFFNQIILARLKDTQKQLFVFYKDRNPLFMRKIQIFFKRKRKETFQKIKKYSKYIESLKKLRVIGVIWGKCERIRKQWAFSLIFGANRNTKAQKSVEVYELQNQMADMAVQLQNKNDNIQRLQTELTSLRIQQTNYQNNGNTSYGEYSNNDSRRKPPFPHSKSLKKFVQNQGSHNYSQQKFSLNDFSIGSILGSLNKSRNGSVSRLSVGQCSCAYKMKYNKYKHLAQSLKSQLDIVKQQLQVSKDLNQHFTNQIKLYLSGGESQQSLNILKKQKQVLEKQRDQLRQKVFKYQKHISHLKSQFKFKMQQIYRKVRKQL